MNTYGIHSVNTETFNLSYHDSLNYPRPLRNVVVTALRVTNLVLNVLGYIPGVKFVSGCIRMALGLAIVGVTTAIGDRNASQGLIIGRFYDEAITTGISQIARGALEALVPYGWVVNATLDVVATPFNVLKELKNASMCPGCIADGNHIRPHDDAEYPLPLFPLYLA